MATQEQGTEIGGILDAIEQHMRDIDDLCAKGLELTPLDEPGMQRHFGQIREHNDAEPFIASEIDPAQRLAEAWRRTPEPV